MSNISDESETVIDVDGYGDGGGSAGAYVCVLLAINEDIFRFSWARYRVHWTWNSINWIQYVTSLECKMKFSKLSFIIQIRNGIQFVTPNNLDINWVYKWLNDFAKQPFARIVFAGIRRWWIDSNTSKTIKAFIDHEKLSTAKLFNII